MSKISIRFNNNHEMRSVRNEERKHLVKYNIRDTVPKSVSKVYD